MPAGMQADTQGKKEAGSDGRVERRQIITTVGRMRVGTGRRN
jgi:hypothetical protein